MNTLFGVYLGDCKNHRPLKEVALREWEQIFIGNKEECSCYVKENHPEENLCYLIIELSHQSTGKTNRPIRFRSQIISVDKIIDSGGIHKSYQPPGQQRKWKYHMKLSNGTEGTVTYKDYIPPWRIGEPIVYRIKQTNKEILIIIE